ncbi:MAG TPA: GIY-YIG nuclease family protein [Roseiarcus sp.]|nr:GIY-YIG nuclease family protein [Roseiarcus sp.]
MDELSDDELLEALGVVVETKKPGAHTPREERVLAGFEDIVNFVKEHGRAPLHGEERDIFERLYAVRLDRLREQPEFLALLAPHDEFGLLSGKAEGKPHEPQSDDELLAELGVDIAAPDSLTVLKHVRPRIEIQTAEEIAARTPCKDFEAFKPLFDQVQKEIETGVRKTRPFEANQEGAQIKPGEFFILGGQKAYVAEAGEEFLTEQGRKNARMRVIFDNGTEIRGLLRSFQRALYKDEAGRWITSPSAGPLFDQSDAAEGDETGTIYVLRSKSSDPEIAPHREVLHKIGVTGGDVRRRIAAAVTDATYLLADVEVVATYTLRNINRTKLENLLHRFFSAARLDMELRDRFGNPVKPSEWFLVPLPVIDEVVERIKDETIVDYQYDPASASIVKRA